MGVVGPVGVLGGVVGTVGVLGGVVGVVGAVGTVGSGGVLGGVVGVVGVLGGVVGVLGGVAGVVGVEGELPPPEPLPGPRMSPPSSIDATIFIGKISDINNNAVNKIHLFLFLPLIIFLPPVIAKTQLHVFRVA